MTKSRKNDYNLSVSTYVEAEDIHEMIDIKDLNKQIHKNGNKGMCHMQILLDIDDFKFLEENATKDTLNLIS